MAWVGDHLFSYAQWLYAGFTINCPESGDTVMTDLREIGPTYYFAPPRVFENLLTQVMIRMEDASAIKRWLFKYFTGVARRCGAEILDGDPVGLADRLLYALGNVLIYGPLRNVLGMSNIRIAYTAGAAIGPDLFRFYRSIGINLKQLYGQTETCAYVCLQPDRGVKFDTVGVAGAGVEIKIAENGEVLVRGPMLLKEYYKRPDATAESIDGDGYFHTGDAGVIDGAGHLRIIDRAKDVGRMAGGAMFAPNYLENKLKFSPHIKEAVAFGADRDMVCAFVNIDVGSVGNWAERRALPYSGYTDLAGKPEVYELIRECVEQVNAELATEGDLAASQIHRFLILHKELDPDDDELTRTRKVRRGFVAREVPGADRRAVLGTQGPAHRDRREVRGRTRRAGRRRPRDRRGEDVPGASAGGARERRGLPRRDPGAQRRIGDVDPQARPHLARVRRGAGAEGHLLRRPRARGARDHRPQRRGQELDAERDQRRLPAAAGNDHLPRQGAARHGHARRRGGRHRAHVPEHRALPRHVGAGQHHDGPQSQDEGDLSRAGDLVGTRAQRRACSIGARSRR